MFQDNTNAQHRIWHESAHASLCALGVYLRRIGLLTIILTFGESSSLMWNETCV